MKTEFDLDGQALREMGRLAPDPAELAATRVAVIQRIGRRRFPGELRWATALGAVTLVWLGFALLPPKELVPDLAAVNTRLAPVSAPEVALAPPRPPLARKHAQPIQAEPRIEAVGSNPASGPDQPAGDVLRVSSGNSNVVIYWLVEDQGD